MIHWIMPLYNEDPTPYDALNTILHCQSQTYGILRICIIMKQHSTSSLISPSVIVTDSAGKKTGYFFHYFQSQEI